jgi:hypothetical protein
LLGSAFDRGHLPELPEHDLSRLEHDLTRLKLALLKLLWKGTIEARGKRYLEGGEEFGREQSIPVDAFKESVRLRLSLDCLEATLESGPDKFNRFADAREKSDWHRIRLDREQILAYAPALLGEIVAAQAQDPAAPADKHPKMSIDEMRWRWFVSQYLNRKPRQTPWKTIAQEYRDDPSNELDTKISDQSFAKSINRYRAS